MGGRMGSGFSSFGDEDPMGSPFGGRASPFGSASFMGGAPQGRRSGARTASPSSRRSTMQQPSEITRPLPLSLEDLYSGVTKKLKIGRKLQSGQQEER
jgi:DnaJ family protein B protein 4